MILAAVKAPYTGVLKKDMFKISPSEILNCGLKIDEKRTGQCPVFESQSSLDPCLLILFQSGLTQ